MPKSTSIKWRNKDKQIIANKVKSYNAKITRLLTQVPELVEFLPKKISVKTLKKEIKTRKDFNNAINSINRFFKKDATKTVVNKQGIKTTKYELNELKLKVRKINRERKKILEERAPSTEKGTMGSIEENNLKPKKFNWDTMQKSNWDSFVGSVEKQSGYRYWDERASNYKINYLAAFDTIFGDAYPDLRNKIEKIMDMELFDVYYDDPYLQLDFYYSPEAIATKAMLIDKHLNERFGTDFDEADYEDAEFLDVEDYY